MIYKVTMKAHLERGVSTINTYLKEEEIVSFHKHQFDGDMGSVNTEDVIELKDDSVLYMLISIESV